MTDYISREAVINITIETGAWETQNRVRELPTVDVQPTKSGKWICTNNYETLAYGTLYYSRCSICGEESLEEGNFCPNCGARMKAE